MGAPTKTHIFCLIEPAEQTSDVLALAELRPWGRLGLIFGVFGARLMRVITPKQNQINKKTNNIALFPPLPNQLYVKLAIFSGRQPGPFVVESVLWLFAFFFNFYIRQ